MEDKRIVRSVAESLSRLNDSKTQVVDSTRTSHLVRHVNNVSKPNSPSSTMKKAGIALIVATPDPFTAVPGVALIATSYALKRKEPTKLEDLAAETRKILRDIQSLSL